MNIIKGAKVLVFEDQIQCTRIEGIATVTKVLEVCDWNDANGHQIVRCNVRFPRSEYNSGGVYERDVSRLAKATGSAA